MATATEAYDLLFVIDATQSMQFYLAGVRQALPQIMHMSAITGLVKRMGILVYRDYDCRDLLEFSGWSQDTESLCKFLGNVLAHGGGDTAEAVKTAMHKMFDIVTGPTLTVIYTDAPPHHAAMPSTLEHMKREMTAVGVEGFDWVGICRKAKALDIKVSVVLDHCRCNCLACWYPFMSLITGGATISMEHLKSAEHIGRKTVGLFLSWIGYEYDFGTSRMLHLQNPDVASTAASDRSAGILRIFPPLLRSRMNGRAMLMQSVLEMDARMLPIVKEEVKVQPLVQPNVLDRFWHDQAYQDRVFEMFKKVLNPQNVISLTYNTLFGQVWRAISRKRDDPRREGLLYSMSNSIGQLPEDTKEVMKQYIEASYDQSDVIQEMLAKHNPDGLAAITSPILVLETATKLPRSELMEISRSSTPAVIKKVSGLLTGLRVVTKGPLPQHYLPLAMSDRDLFAALPHLMCPGTMFSLRPAALLAIITATGTQASPLHAKAVSFLQRIKGTWIDKALPENISLDMVRLLLRYPPALTDSEVHMYHHINRVGGLKINALTDMDVVVGFSSNKTVRPDHKHPCRTCPELRPSSLITADGRCAACVIGTDVYERTDKTKSVWCECSNCKVHYAVLRPDALRVKPKCHFCRHAQTAPKRRCGLCKNDFMWQLPYDAEAHFVCPPCGEHGSSLTETLTVPLQEYTHLNGLGCVGLNLTDAAKFWSTKSLFHTKHLVEPTQPEPCGCHTIGKKSVHNQGEVINKISSWIESGKSEYGTCSLCCEDLEKAALLPFCGRRNCEAKGCRDCIAAWFTAFRKGTILIPPNLFCAFCKKTPSPKTIRKYNPDLFALGPLDVEALDSAYYYGWCKACAAVKPAVAKNCAEDVPVMTTFECDDCRDNRCKVDVKECPWCTVAISRTGGCAHIHCSSCDKHFCWLCLHKSEGSGEIYRHMSAVHHGYGYDNPDDDLYRDDSEDDEYEYGY